MERSRVTQFTILFQLTRSRGARRYARLPLAVLLRISTHALTWSATAVFCGAKNVPLISTHALTWSATRGGRCAQPTPEYFNSRAHVERDGLSIAFSKKPLQISTHALTWSATSCCAYSIKIRKISTHALTWSATSLPDYMNLLYQHFNSRAHVERDHDLTFIGYTSSQISTHALTWSATSRKGVHDMPRSISTHALTWSATVDCLISIDGIDISTHALTWSATIPYILNAF